MVLHYQGQSFKNRTEMTAEICRRFWQVLSQGKKASIPDSIVDLHSPRHVMHSIRAEHHRWEFTRCSVVLFFCQHGLILLELLLCAISKHSQKRTIKWKRSGLFSKVLILLYNNDRPHIANVVSDTLCKFRWEVLVYPLQPCCIPVFRELNGERFT